MKLITDNIEDLKAKYRYTTDERHSDEKLNLYHNNWRFLSDYHEKIINESNITSEDVLYSMYYWGHLFLERANEISYDDAGYEQCHFQLIEQIEHCCGEVDLSVIEKIENNEL